jgi:hypothetical protein
MDHGFLAEDVNADPARKRTASVRQLHKVQVFEGKYRAATACSREYRAPG